MENPVLREHSEPSADVHAELPNFRLVVRLRALLSPRLLREYVRMATCSVSTQNTKLLGGRHDAIPSENAKAKHEA